MECLNASTEACKACMNALSVDHETKEYRGKIADVQQKGHMHTSAPFGINNQKEKPGKNEKAMHPKSDKTDIYII